MEERRLVSVSWDYFTVNTSGEREYGFDFIFAFIFIMMIAVENKLQWKEDRTRKWSDDVQLGRKAHKFGALGEDEGCISNVYIYCD